MKALRIVHWVSVLNYFYDLDCQEIILEVTGLCNFFTHLCCFGIFMLVYANLISHCIGIGTATCLRGKSSRFLYLH